MIVRALWILALALASTLPYAGTADANPPAAKAARSATTSKMERGVGDRRRIIGILDVRVEGVPREIAAQFETQLEKQLGSRAYWLAPKSRMLQMMESSTRWTEGCVVGTCLSEVRTQTGAELVLLAAITGADNTFGFVVTLVRTDNGRMLSQQAARCDVCTVNEVLASATLAAVHLLTDLPDVLPDEPTATSSTLAASSHRAAHARTRRRHKRIAIATVLTGLAVAGTGAALYFAGDRAPYALATTAAGGGLLLAGMFTLTF